jgi:uncharacterized protein with PIN domain
MSELPPRCAECDKELTLEEAAASTLIFRATAGRIETLGLCDECRKTTTLSLPAGTADE